jgi:hypothetical protein
MISIISSPTMISIKIPDIPCVIINSEYCTTWDVGKGRHQKKLGW